MDFNPFSTNELNAPELLNSIGNGGGGFMQSFGNLMSNPLMQQFLAAYGKDLTTGSGTTNLSNAVQGNVASNSYLKMLQGMLGGGVPPEGASMKVDPKGMSFTIPHPADTTKGTTPSKSPDNTNPITGQIKTPGIDTGVSLDQLISGLRGSSGTNPFVSSGGGSGSPLAGLTMEDIAGLTPQMISSALGTKMAMDKMKAGQIDSAINNLYKTVLTAQILDTMKNKAPIIPVTLSDGSTVKLSREQYIKWQQLTDAQKTSTIKNYEFAKQRGYKGTLTDFMSEESGLTGHIKDYRMYVDQTTKAGKTPMSFENWLTKQKTTPAPKTPTPMSWNQAYNAMMSSFGKQDPTGMWAITPELKLGADKAKEFFDSYRKGGMDPLTAANKAAVVGRKYQHAVDAKYWQYYNLADGDKDKIEKLKAQFYKLYGYIPTRGTY